MPGKKKGGVVLTWTPLPVNDYNGGPAFNSRGRVLLVSPEIGKILSSNKVITPEQFKVLSKHLS